MAQNFHPFTFSHTPCIPCPILLSPNPSGSDEMKWKVGYMFFQNWSFFSVSHVPTHSLHLVCVLLFLYRTIVPDNRITTALYRNWMRVIDTIRFSLICEKISWTRHPPTTTHTPIHTCLHPVPSYSKKDAVIHSARNNSDISIPIWVSFMNLFFPLPPNADSHKASDKRKYLVKSTRIKFWFHVRKHSSYP